MYKLTIDFLTKQTITHGIMRVVDNAFIPFEPSLPEYQTYLEWLAEGNQPEPADA